MTDRVSVSAWAQVELCSNEEVVLWLSEDPQDAFVLGRRGDPAVEDLRHRLGLAGFWGSYRVTYRLDPMGPLVVYLNPCGDPAVEDFHARVAWPACFLPREWVGKRVRREISDLSKGG